MEAKWENSENGQLRQSWERGRIAADIVLHAGVTVGMQQGASKTARKEGFRSFPTVKW